MTSDETALQPRMALAPEIVEADRPENQDVKDVAFPQGLKESELDVAMWNQLQDAKMRQTEFETRLNGKSIEFEGRTYTAKERAIQSVRNDRATLDRYRQHRISRGEKPFQYLEQGQRLERDQQFRDRLPFFVRMFSGPESFEQAFPEEHRAAVSDRFKGSLNPARDKMQTANMMLVSERTEKPIEDLQKLWPAYRNQFAIQFLGAAGPVDEASFYALAGKKVSGEKADDDLASTIKAKVTAMAASNRPLGDAMEEARKLAGDRWKEFEPTAKSAYAGVLSDYDDEELATGRELFQNFAKLQGGKPVEQVTDSTAGFFNYAKMPQEKRERVLGLIASQAEAEGEDAEGYFKRLGAALGPSFMGIGASQVSFKDRDTAKLYQRILDRGTLPLPREDEKLRPIDQWEPENVESAWFTGNLQGSKSRPITDEERGMLETAQGLHEGRAMFIGDILNSGIKTRRFLGDQNRAWYKRIDDYTLMAAESLPVMAFAAAPYGSGLLPLVINYGERNLADYRSQMPDADPAMLGRMAYTSAAFEAGIDRLEWLTLGARVPKMNAALLKWGKPGALGVFATRAFGVGVTQTGQEVLQDFTAPAVQELAAALSEDIKGPKWNEVLERERQALGDIFAVSMVFGIIGGAGSTIADVMQAPKLKAALTDRQGLALAGYSAETVDTVAKLAETNPAAAAETLKAAAMETPVEVRKANSEAARAKLETNPLPTPEEALIPSIEKRDDGGYQVRYPDGRVDSAESEMDAIEAVRMWEDEDLNRMDIANRALARELERSHADNPELGANFKFSGKEVSMESWAGDNAQKIEVARQRVRIAMRDEFVSGMAETDGSEIADADLPLGAYLILGTSQNFGGAVTRIAAEIHKQGNVATVLEEHAEGVVKWLMSSGRYSRADVIRGIRETEAATGKQTLADNLDSLAADASERAIVEAFSRLAVANAFGKVPESNLSAKFKALFRALKEAFSAVLSLAGQIREIQLAGQMDEQFEYWLDVAGGVSERYQMENLQKAAEREMQEAAMEGFPEITSTLKGKLPRHETLRQQGGAFAGEVERLYDGMKNSSANGASPAARTRVANEFFLPVGEMADLDQLRVAANAKGFAFETPGEMLDALDLSVNYGRPQYGLHAESDVMPSFSLGLEPGFYSQLETAIEAKVPNNATPEQILATVDPSRGSGVKAEEIKWSGLAVTVERLAAENGGKVPKTALLEQLRNEGRVRFFETANDADPSELADAKAQTEKAEAEDNRVRNLAFEALEAGGASRVEQLNLVDAIGRFRHVEGVDTAGAAKRAMELAPSFDWDLVLDAAREAENARADLQIVRSGSPQYAQYTVPGGTNYREVVLSMPEQGRIVYTADDVKHLPAGSPEATHPGLFHYFRTPDNVWQIPKARFATVEAARDYILREKQPPFAPADQNYHSRHFDEVPNYLAHYRTTERGDGLFIEELQSDRHQEGRNKGYRGEIPTDEEVRRFFDLNEDANPADYREEMMEHGDHKRDAVADAPFRKDWPLQLFKRALRDAVAGGKDWIGWTTGKTQAERFDLSKQIDNLSVTEWPAAGEGMVLLAAYKGESRVIKETIHRDKLPDYIGKEAAGKVMEQPAVHGSRELSGIDLQVGGEGMAGFYDKILPSEVGKYVKKWGAKVEKGSLAGEDAGGGFEIGPEGVVPKGSTSTPIWRIEITESMRQGVEEGQPTFSLGSNRPPVILKSQFHESHLARTDAGGTSKDDGGPEEASRRRIGETLAGGNGGYGQRHVGDGAESVVVSFDEGRVLKEIKRDGVNRYAPDRGYTFDYSFEAVAEKAHVINALGGMPTSAFEADGRLFLIQDEGAPITQSEYEKIVLPFGIVPAKGHVFRVPIDGREYFVSDLHRENFRKDSQGEIRLIDLVTGEATPGASPLAEANTSSLSIARYKPFELRETDPTVYIRSETGILLPDGRSFHTNTAAPGDLPAGNGGFGERLRTGGRRHALAGAAADLGSGQALGEFAENLGELPEAEARGSVSDFWEWLAGALNSPAMRELAEPRVLLSDTADLFETPIIRENSRALGAEYITTESGGVFYYDPENDVFSFGTLPTEAEVNRAIKLNEDPATALPTFGAVRATSPLLAAIEELARSPEATAGVFKSMRVKVGEVRERLDKTRRESGFSEEDLDPERFERLRDIATLEAIGKALPLAIRGKIVSSFARLEEFKTAKGRENYLVKLLPKIEAALETHMQDLYRAAIRREMQRGAVKVSEAKTRGGKIGATGHMIFDQAKAAMKLDPEAAELEATKLQDQIDGADSLTMEQLAELDSRLSAVELFHDYQSASAARLEKGLELLKDTYREGRKQWLETLMERRILREQRIKVLKRGLGMTYLDDDGNEKDVFITDAMRTAAKNRDRQLKHAADEAVMAAGLSGSQKIRRLAELSDDPMVKKLVQEMEDAFHFAETNEADFNLADNAALAEALREILGVKTVWGVSGKLHELSTPKGASPVEKIEGRAKEDVAVPINVVEAILAGEVSGFVDAKGRRIEVDAHDLEALTESWDRFNDLQEEEQAKRRVIHFERVRAKGERKTVGQISQLEGLMLYLTMRQPDQAKKLERLGYDDKTMGQLEAWLKPEVKNLGSWMVDFLGADAFTVDALHRAEKGVALPLVENYFPVRNDVSGSDSGGLSLDGAGQQQSGRSVGFVKQRVANNAPPAYVNALAVFTAHRAQANFWKSHVTAIREWGGIVRDERFSAAVKTSMGNAFYQSLTRLMERVESGGALSAKQQLGVERMVRHLTRNFALGTLGLRMSTIMVNATAVLNAGLEISASDLIKGMADVMKRPAAFKDAWQSPAIQRRLKAGGTFEAQLAKAQGPVDGSVKATLQWAAEKGVAPINIIDTGSNVLGAAVVWEHTRNKAARAGLPEATAKLEADRAVERLFLRAAQPASRLAKSEIEMRALDNPLGALFLMFTSEPRKSLAIAYMAGREILTGKGTYGKPMAAQQLAVSLVVMSAATYVVRSAIAALSKAKDDEEDELVARFMRRMTDGKAWANAIATSHLQSVPLLGEIWSQISGRVFDQKTFQSSPNILNQGTGKMIDVIAEFGEEKTTRDAVEGGIDLMQGFGTVVPGGALLSQLGNAGEFVEGTLHSNGVDLSPADRIERFKSKFTKFDKELEALHGKTKGEDGKIREDVQVKKWKAKADWLRANLATWSEKDRNAFLDKVEAAKGIRKLLK